MSLKTKILGLFKYDPDKDGASTFNIKQALNDNWDKLDNEVAARVKTTELATEVKKTVKGGGLTAPELGAEKAGAITLTTPRQRRTLHCLRQLTTCLRRMSRTPAIRTRSRRRRLVLSH